jgi:hypothetical protein
MKTLSAVFLFSLLALPAWAVPVVLGTVKLRDGRQFEDVKVIKVEPDGLRVEHRSGLGKLKVEDLPPELAQRFSLDEATASAWRMEEKKRLDTAAEARRQAEVRALAEAPRAEQDAQARTQRMSIFDQKKASFVNYVVLDDQLLTWSQLWKDAGREDLAARFEEDRAVLKQQEIARPATSQEKESQALAQRVANLQQAVAAVASRQPITTTTIVMDSNPGRIRPSYYDPGYYNPRPSIYLQNPAFNQPAYCPPIAVRPPVMPRPVNMGNPMVGSHLWKK